MSLPPPSAKQARLIWAAVTGLSLALIVALVIGAVWGLGRVLGVLGGVLWPLAVAGVIAYLLDPVVDFFERHKIPRTRAILLVFFVAVMVVVGVFASIVPRLVVETRQFATNVPEFAGKAEAKVAKLLNAPPKSLLGVLEKLGIRWITPTADTNAPAATNDVATGVATVAAGPKMEVDPETVKKVTDWMTDWAKGVGTWFGRRVSQLAGLFGVIAGLALIPIYLFYLLLEKRSIADNWTAYLPAGDKRLKAELVFVLGSINDYLIAFFRGQLLVALCDGVLYAIGFSIIGLPYAALIGAAAMVLTIIPFLGAIVTCGTALLIALVTFGDWQHPLLVVAVFAVVQGIEGYVLQPRILGNRVGLHPMVIIIAIMTGTTLLGGILGGLLAIPMAAALRVILAKYVWKQPAA